jgi:ADP-ribosylglycohydrolase
MRARGPDATFDRGLGTLLGLAIGDALGMPSQTLTRGEISALYGEITDFVAAADGQPVSAGLPAATITDDTEQTVLLAQHLIANDGSVNDAQWAAELMEWEYDTRRRGVNDLLGPSTRRALDLLNSGVPASQTGRSGTTNGAAMRIAPVGIMTPPEPLWRLVAHVEDASRITHNTPVALASASAVAATISAAIDNADFTEAAGLGLAAAQYVEAKAADTTHLLSRRIDELLALAARPGAIRDVTEVAAHFGTGVAALESVPMAFHVASLADGSVWQAGLLSANLGDDTDTIGAISCAMLGACAGAGALPPDKVSLLRQVNSLPFEYLCRGLLQLRTRFVAPVTLGHVS